MIDRTLRREWILRAAAGSYDTVILLDVILGYGPIPILRRSSPSHSAATRQPGPARHLAV